MINQIFFFFSTRFQHRQRPASALDPLPKTHRLQAVSRCLPLSLVSGGCGWNRLHLLHRPQYHEQGNLPCNWHRTELHCKMNSAEPFMFTHDNLTADSQMLNHCLIKKRLSMKTDCYLSPWPSRCQQKPSLLSLWTSSPLRCHQHCQLPWQPGLCMRSDASKALGSSVSAHRESISVDR